MKWARSRSRIKETLNKFPTQKGDLSMNENKSSNYELKSEAVEKLVDAQKGDVPQFSQEELNKYRSKKLSIPEWVKVIFIKAWFAGAVCFFVLWGLGAYLTAMLDMLFVAGAALGMVTDLLTNNVLRFIEKNPGSNDKWLLCARKGVVGFGINLLCAYVILLCVYVTYSLINYTIISATGAVDTMPLGVEPVLFGLLYMGYEMLLIGMKRMVQGIIRDAKNAARNQSST